MRYNWLILVAFLSISLLASGQIDNQVFSSDIEALDSLKSFFNMRWKSDSLRAADLGLPLVQSNERSTISFTGFEGTRPIYVSQNTEDEIKSYYGDQLWALPYGVTGTGYFMGMWEAFFGNNALPNPNNGNLLSAGALPSRVFAQNGGFVSNHATNVALRMAGDGVSNSNSGLGNAITANIAAWDITNLFSEMTSNIAFLLVSNHSYGQVSGWTTPISWTLGGVTKSVNWFSESNVNKTEDYNFGRYGSDDFDLDLLSRLAPYHCIVKSAGNDRGDNGSIPVTTFNTIDNGSTYTFDTYSSPVPEVDGGTNGFDCLPSGAVSKNAFIIGSCNNISGGYSSSSDVITPSFSSYGPTDDGRIKPDFVAPGQGGTSFAAPNVSGAILLLQQIHYNQTDSYLKSATIKALLAQTAFEAGPNPGPDYKHGWGLINPKGAADIIIDQSGMEHINEATLANAEAAYFLIYSDGTKPITATLCWTDPEINPVARTYGALDLDNPTSRLVNDLDMRIVDLSNVVQASPYVLDPSNPANAATTADNFRDNIEKISFASPSAGWYAVRIDHKGTLANPQDYSLVISGASSGNCCADALPLIDNTWNGAWNAAFVDGQNVVVEDDYTLLSSTIFNDAVFNSNVVVTVPTGNTLTITGNAWSFENVTFNGDGRVVLAGTADQAWCGGAAMNNVEVNNGNGVSLDGTPLAINDSVVLESGILNANGRLILLSSPGNYAQVHENNGSIAGDVEFQQTITSQGWHNISSPVKTTVGDLVEDMTDYVLQENGGSIYSWDAANGKWTHPLDTTIDFDEVSPFNAFFGNSGTRTYSTIPFTISLKGPVFSGPVNNTVVYGLNTAISNGAGWNLLANPYPQNLGWNTIKGNFGGLNINAGYSVWDANAGLYRTHDGAIGDAQLGGFIAPGQAFFVKLNDAAAEATTAFDFTNANRTRKRADFLKTAPTQLVLRVIQNGKTDAFYLAFAEGSSVEFNSKIDSYKLFSPEENVPQIYFPADTNSGVAIKYIGPEQEAFTLPIAYKNTAEGAAIIELDESSIAANWSISLEDLKLDYTHDLRSGAYLFDHNPSFLSNRFLLHIGDQEITSGSNELIAWGSDGMLNLKLDHQIIDATIRIYNVIGEDVLFSKHETLQTLQIPFEKRGVYVISISDNEGRVYTTKWVN